MKYIFCPSYESLYFVLYYQYSNKDFTVITYNWGIKCFCNHLRLKYIYFEYSSLSGKNIIRHIIQLYRLRKKLDDITANCNPKTEDKFYLLGHIISWPGFYLALKFSKKCRVYFKPVSGAMEIYVPKEGRDQQLKDYWRVYYLRWIVQLIFGMPTTIYSTRVKHVIGINETFFKKYGIQQLPLDKSIHDFRTNVLKNPKQFVNKTYDTMLLYEAPYLKSNMSPDTIQYLYKKMTSCLTNFVVKGRPDIQYENYEYLPSEVTTFLSYFPSELLYRNIRKYIVGIISASLVTVKYMPHLKAVSVLELAKWKTPREKQYYKDFLIQQHNKILFPKTWKEFREIIEGIR